VFVVLRWKRDVVSGWRVVVVAAVVVVALSGSSCAGGRRRYGSGDDARWWAAAATATVVVASASAVAVLPVPRVPMSVASAARVHRVLKKLQCQINVNA
jgi:hypothetical protein